MEIEDFTEKEQDQIKKGLSTAPITDQAATMPVCLLRGCIAFLDKETGT